MTSSIAPCLKDNIGWSCTRPKNHDGDCTPSGNPPLAPVPDELDKIGLAFWESMFGNNVYANADRYIIGYGVFMTMFRERMLEYGRQDDDHVSTKPYLVTKDRGKFYSDEKIAEIKRQERQALVNDLDNYTAEHDQPFVQWTRDWLTATSNTGEEKI